MCVCVFEGGVRAPDRLALVEEEGAELAELLVAERVIDDGQ